MVSFDRDGHAGQLRYAGKHRKTAAQLRAAWLPLRRGVGALESPIQAGDDTLSEDRSERWRPPADS
jgi:hypothetical protein